MYFSGINSSWSGLNFYSPLINNGYFNVSDDLTYVYLLFALMLYIYLLISYILTFQFFKVDQLISNIIKFMNTSHRDSLVLRRHHNTFLSTLSRIIFGTVFLQKIEYKRSQPFYFCSNLRIQFEVWKKMFSIKYCSVLRSSTWFRYRGYSTLILSYYNAKGTYSGTCYEFKLRDRLKYFLCEFQWNATSLDRQVVYTPYSSKLIGVYGRLGLASIIYLFSLGF